MAVLMNLEQELWELLQKYATKQREWKAQRALENEATQRLLAINRWRAEHNMCALEPADEHRHDLARAQAMQSAQAYYSPPPRTWRDDMRDEVMACVEKWWEASR